jgi:hypothetical protein
MRVAECPQCRWVPVVDATGRRRLEMRWGGQAPGSAPSTRDGRVVAASSAR